jgi:hypothetical protein
MPIYLLSGTRRLFHLSFFERLSPLLFLIFFVPEILAYISDAFLDVTYLSAYDILLYIMYILNLIYQF